MYAWCGPQPNSRLLINYGICDENNPYDKLPVTVTLDNGDPLFKAKRGRLQVCIEWMVQFAYGVCKWQRVPGSYLRTQDKAASIPTSILTHAACCMHSIIMMLRLN